MMRKIIASIFAAALLLSNGITAFAATEVISADGVNTVFDAEYYTIANPDVAAAVGKGRDALVQHYISYGKAENRPAYPPCTDADAFLASAAAIAMGNTAAPAVPVNEKKIRFQSETTAYRTT